MEEKKKYKETKHSRSRHASLLLSLAPGTDEEQKKKETRKRETEEAQKEKIKNIKKVLTC